MIAYFSGTGNTEYVARSIANLIGNDTVEIAKTDPKSLYFSGSFFCLCFPIHSWGVPGIVLSFIDSLSDEFVNRLNGEHIPVIAVCTCGDDTGLAPEMLANALAKKGIELKGCWSVQMPNTYVLLPGFDVDSVKTERWKLAKAPGRIHKIVEDIKRKDWKVDVTRGSLPWLKTKVVYPMTRLWRCNPKKFTVSQECIGCGRCVAACPTGNIRMRTGHPSWGMNCTSCLACYHSCPTRALGYNNRTEGKGQYYCPLHPIKK